MDVRMANDLILLGTITMKDFRMSFKVQVGTAQISIHQGQTVLLTETQALINLVSACAAIAARATSGPAQRNRRGGGIPQCRRNRSQAYRQTKPRGRDCGRPPRASGDAIVAKGNINECIQPEFKLRYHRDTPIVRQPPCRPIAADCFRSVKPITARYPAKR